MGGIGGDVIFSYLPLADNFFHGQATLMLSPRLPLYIVTYYVGWFYMPMILCWQLHLRPLPEACLCALLCFAYYILAVGRRRCQNALVDMARQRQRLHSSACERALASNQFVLLQYSCSVSRGLSW